MRNEKDPVYRVLPIKQAQFQTGASSSRAFIDTITHWVRLRNPSFKAEFKSNGLTESKENLSFGIDNSKT